MLQDRCRNAQAGSRCQANQSRICVYWLALCSTLRRHSTFRHSIVLSGTLVRAAATKRRSTERIRRGSSVGLHVVSEALKFCLLLAACCMLYVVRCREKLKFCSLLEQLSRSKGIELDEEVLRSTSAATLHLLCYRPRRLLHYSALP
jgi:hypothetical protein